MQQIERDRERTSELYGKVVDLMKNSGDYAMLGDVAVKLSDLMTKQTNQLIEVYKTEEKNKPPKDNGLDLSSDEREELEEKLEENSRKVSNF